MGSFPNRSSCILINTGSFTENGLVCPTYDANRIPGSQFSNFGALPVGVFLKIMLWLHRYTDLRIASTGIKTFDRNLALSYHFDPNFSGRSEIFLKRLKAKASTRTDGSSLFYYIFIIYNICNYFSTILVFNN